MTYLKKFAPALIFPSVILTGCSLGGSNFGHYSPDESYRHTQSSAYSQPCHQSVCTSSYSVSDTHYDYAPQYSEPAYQGPSYQENGYTAAEQPSPYAYGTHVVQNGPLHASQIGYGTVPQLRGVYDPMKRGYKYGTLGASLYDVDSDIFGAQGRLGYQSAGLLGVELEGFAGVTKEKETNGTTTLKAGVDYTLGAFGVLRSNITPKWSVHSRAGYHFTELSGEATDGVTTIEVDIDGQNGFAYGIGTEYALSQRDFIRADYTRYDQDFGQNDAVSIAYGRKF